MTLEYVSKWDEMYQKTVKVLCAPEPVFYGRIGGSDTDAVISYFAGLEQGESQAGLLERVRPHRHILERFNGYYDKSARPENLLAFCSTLMVGYQSLTHASLVVSELLTAYFPDFIAPQFKVELAEKRPLYDAFMRALDRDHTQKFFYPYPFIEKLTIHPWSMFCAFQEILANKTVLVVSPFSKSIEANFARRRRFFKNYDYPEFTLKTLQTPITYQGLPDEMYPHADWFETVEALRREIETVDFDIALLSCGSYAMPLGGHVAARLRRKAIYVGGVLQLYFGIMGRRYQNSFVLGQINQDSFILAEEREQYLQHVSIEPTTAHEAFGAYL